ncbi:GNAT family N-acetyltransferase, partial [Kitasatospora sp. NPDC047058]|uniref:GNAT family N-acetyltransferase n=1 Tax=Kitasatospora sp. NPDC047058 TaxID=3155620 RepID=UPI0033C49DBF
MSIAGLRRGTAEALLADGTTVTIRPVGPQDREAVLSLHTDRMSDESRRLRFFGVSLTAPLLAADRLCGAPRNGLLCLGAWAGDELIGEADCEIPEDRPETAELALAVADRWHRRGAATLLLEHLVHAARGRGVRVFEADTLAGNRGVHKVFADLGLPVHRRLDRGEIRVRVPLDESDERYRAAVDERVFYAGHTVEMANLKAILEHRHRHGLPV